MERVGLLVGVVSASCSSSSSSAVLRDFVRLREVRLGDRRFVGVTGNGILRGLFSPVRIAESLTVPFWPFVELKLFAPPNDPLTTAFLVGVVKPRAEIRAATRAREVMVGQPELRSEALCFLGPTESLSFGGVCTLPVLDGEESKTKSFCPWKILDTFSDNFSGEVDICADNCAGVEEPSSRVSDDMASS